MESMRSKPLIRGIPKPVSPLILGTAFYRLESKEHWFSLLDDYRTAGGTALDSGRSYGTSEDVLGEWMDSRSVRDKMVIITKCGHGLDWQLPAEGLPDVVREELSTSLRTLKTEYVDLLLLHRDNQYLPVGDILEPLNHEVSSGRVRAIGASNWEYRRVVEAQEYADKRGMTGFAAVSNNLSLAKPTASFYPGLLSVDKVGERWHQETGIPLIPWSSQARGFFTGRYCPDAAKLPSSSALKEDDVFRSRMIQVYGTEENCERLARARRLGERNGGYTAVEVALAWLLHKPFPVVPVVGPHTGAELASCVKALSLSLAQSDVKWLDLETGSL